MATQRDTIAAQNAALEERVKETLATTARPQGRKTFIGGLGEAISAQESAIKKLTEARAKGDLAEPLDTKLIRRSRFANRLPARFTGPKYDELKKAIQVLGKNQMPILVRPVDGDALHNYEIVYGHRRHQACSDLGIPVRATVQQLTDLELTVLMDLENKARDDLSPFEEALFLKNLLTEFSEEYPSQKVLAQKTDRSEANLSQLMGLLQYPDQVRTAFSDPTAILASWLQHLAKALKNNRDAVTAKAEQLSAMDPRLDDGQVFELLVSEKPLPKAPSPAAPTTRARSRPMKYGRRRVATITKKTDKSLSISFEDVVPESLRRELLSELESEIMALEEVIHDRLQAAGVAK